MRKKTYAFVVTMIHWWEANVLKHPWSLLLLAVIACGAVGKYTADNLTMNTNTADSISTELPFQQNRIKLETTFPQDANTVLLLVEGKTPELTADAVKRIG
ncbi:MAG: putative rane protein, partial [Proteobacteria bacterium]|nr:putative rane protein [Pseudomonadota bacterium]